MPTSTSFAATDEPRPIGPEGTVAFTLKVNRHFSCGDRTGTIRHPIFHVPELAEFYFEEMPGTGRIWWKWEGMEEFRHFYLNLTELPGPQEYHFLLTWKSGEGLFDIFFNGMPFREIGSRFSPWEQKPVPFKPVLTESEAFEVRGLEARPEYLPPELAARTAPEELRERDGALIGRLEGLRPISLDHRLGEVIYSAGLTDAEELAEWRLEGPAELITSSEGTEIRSRKPNAKGPDHGHSVWWCPATLPASFVAEWTAECLSEKGLLIAFFSAQGNNGPSIFDPSQSPRDGLFAHYTNGDIDSYHISYLSNVPFEPGRGTSNLRKNAPSSMLQAGPVGIPAEEKEPRRVRLIKDGARIQLQVEGRPVIDFTDTGEKLGQPYGAGHFGLRQMQWARPRYRDLEIRALQPAPGAALAQEEARVVPSPQELLVVPEIRQDRPRLMFTPASLELMKERIARKKEPWFSASRNILADAARGLKSEKPPAPNTGRHSLEFYRDAVADGERARLFAYAWLISGDEAFARASLKILAAWGTAEPRPASNFDPDIRFPNTGMEVARAAIPFLESYDLLANHPELATAKKENIERWLRSLVDPILEGKKRWIENDYFGQQYFQNHLTAHTMGLAAIGYALGDRELVQFALDHPGNERDFKTLLRGMILMAGQEEQAVKRRPGEPPLRDGEISDRYRHYEAPGKGLPYTHLSLSQLLYTAEIAWNNGIDFYRYTAPGGENLKYSLQFYADFYRTGDSSLKGGFYAGEKVGDRFSLIFEIGHRHYPATPEIVRLLQSIDRPAVPRHAHSYFFYPVLTHGEPVDETPAPGLP